MGKGTPSFGKHNKTVHIRCRRCGNPSYHIQKSKCSACGFPRAKLKNESWRWKKINNSGRKKIKTKNMKPKTSHYGKSTKHK